VHRIDLDERRARLVNRHHLSAARPADDALHATRGVFVLHSSGAPTVFLSVRARARDVTPEDIERALYDDRSLVRMLGMRRTLFVVPLELVAVVEAACTRAIAARERRRLEGMVAAGGISKQPAVWVRRAMATALSTLEELGEAFTSDFTRSIPMLAKRLRVGAGTRFEGTQSAASRVLPQLAMEGRVVRARPRGTWVNGQYRWTPIERWLGHPPDPLDSAPAQVALLRGWLARFGPATETDMRWWTGWTARETRAALAAFPHSVVELDGATGYVLAGDLEPVDRLEPSAAFLPTLDPTTMGWKEREWYVGPYERVLFDLSGNAGPTVWWDGRVVGAWAQRRDGEIAFRLLEDVGAEAVTAIESEADRLCAWIGDARLTSAFLPDFQRSLAE
jgi:hypothetical protein